MILASASPRRAAGINPFKILGILGLALVLPFGASSAQDKPAAAPAQASATMKADEQLAPLPLSPIEIAEKDGNALRLSLKDLTKLALQNNLDIAISDTNEELYQQKVFQAYGPYDPAVTAGLGVQSRKSANTNLSNRAANNYNKTDYAYWNFGFTQNLPTGGGIQATYNTSRQDTNQIFALFTPQYNASASVQFTQPLRRNFRTDQIRSNIKLVNLDLKTNDSQFKQKVVDTISRIQGLYWDLVGTIRDYEIKRESVKLAQITLQNNRKKVEIGTLAPIGITEAQADMASREVDLIASEEKINNVENNLRALISSDRNAEIWRQVVVPTETPEFKEYKVSLDNAIDTALQNRPELEQLAIKMQMADITYNLDSNQKKWQFDLVGGFGAMGVSGPQAMIDPSTGASITCPGDSRCIPTNLVGGAFNSYRTLFTGGFTNWTVGFNVQIPLKNRSLEAQLAQIKIQKRQLLMNRKSVEQQIQVDIRNAVQKIETNRKQVETARVARELAREQLEGEEKRFQAGLSENFRVLDRQRGLSSAQGVELQALITYRKSIIDLQKAMYTLLESNDFEIAKSSSDNVNVPALK
jgi:outer membrane protein